MEILYLSIGLIIGIIATWFIAKFKFSGNLSTLIEKVKSLQELNNELKIELKDKESSLFKLNGNYNAKLADIGNLENKLQENKKEIEKLQEKFTIEFKNLANEILEEKTKKFTEQNRTNLDEILKPLNEKIKDFEKKVENTYEKGLKDQTALQAELKKLYDLNNKISEEANNLTKALKGDIKKQGNWGEIVLERILESSGLVKGREYDTQVSLVDDNDNRYQPDVVVYLPDKKNIIIDAKVSLVAYEKYVNADTEVERQSSIKLHLNSIRNHIKILSDKKYQNLKNLNMPEYVMLFIPIESSFSVAIQEDKELFNEAWNHKIVIVSPSTLIATLLTIASIWKQENQTKNALEIARQGGALYDKFVNLIEDLVQLGNKIEDAQKYYSESMKKLSEGKGNLIGRVEKIRLLGARASKSLPENLIED